MKRRNWRSSRGSTVMQCACRLPLRTNLNRERVGSGPSLYANRAWGSEAAVVLQGERLLIVEDEPFIAMELQDMLEGESATVVRARNCPRRCSTRTTLRSRRASSTFVLALMMRRLYAIR
jgi:hypothetical protein